MRLNSGNIIEASSSSCTCYGWKFQKFQALSISVGVCNLVHSRPRHLTHSLISVSCVAVSSVCYTQWAWPISPRRADRDDSRCLQVTRPASRLSPFSLTF